MCVSIKRVGLVASLLGLFYMAGFCQGVKAEVTYYEDGGMTQIYRSGSFLLQYTIVSSGSKIKKYGPKGMWELDCGDSGQHDRDCTEALRDAADGDEPDTPDTAEPIGGDDGDGKKDGDGTKPTETKPDETKPGETKPDETKPAETTPGRTRPTTPPPSNGGTTTTTPPATVSSLIRRAEYDVRKGKAKRVTNKKAHIAKLIAEKAKRRKR